MSALEATVPTYGEGYEVGHRDGYAAARGEIIRGLHMRAAAAERQAGTATTVNVQAAAAQVARWLRHLADEVMRGEL